MEPTVVLQIQMVCYQLQQMTASLVVLRPDDYMLPQTDQTQTVSTEN